jgi:hypothetical protein
MSWELGVSEGGEENRVLFWKKSGITAVQR